MISIVIAAYNEEKAIGGLLSGLPYSDDIEVIVVDGGSSDRTKDITSRFPARVIDSAKNRGRQFNKGARLAGGDILLFLHADCLIEAGGLKEIGSAIKNGYVGGCFTQRITSDRFSYRLIELSGNIRARLFKIFYGDQGTFVRCDVFTKLGGFDEVELFEDVLFSKKLKRIGKTAVLDREIYVSERRWREQGIIKTTLINWVLTLGFIFAVPPRLLKRIYRDIR